MKTIFWLAVGAEGLAALAYLYRAWTYRVARAAGDYAPPYEKVLIPAAVLALLCLSALVVRFYFQSSQAANILALLPVILVPVAGLVMIFATMFFGGKGH